MDKQKLYQARDFIYSDIEREVALADASTRFLGRLCLGLAKGPKHGWTFDIASGECTAKGDRPLKRYPSKIEGGLLYAEW